jgi:hypothetical protein
VPLLGATRNEGYISGHLDRMLEMTVYSVADAKNRLPTLIDKALSVKR